MPTYVIDASVVIERLLRSTYTPNAQALFRSLGVTDRLIIPEICLVECTNVIWKYVRFQGMPRSQADVLIKDLKNLPLERVPVKALLNIALDIGLKHQLAVYDSVYIVLAKRSNYPLITIDQPQQRAASSEGVTITPITLFN
jgi:predicted nucleic acid-binding protein